MVFKSLEQNVFFFLEDAENQYKGFVNVRSLVVTQAITQVLVVVNCFIAAGNYFLDFFVQND